MPQYSTHRIPRIAFHVPRFTSRIPQSAFRITLLPVLIAVLGTLGCINLAKAYPEKHFFAFTAERAADARQSAPGTRLRVPPLRIHVLFGEKLLVFRVDEQRFEADFYSEYLAAPRLLLTDETRNWLAASGLFESVGDSGTLLEPTHTLEGYVDALYGDVRARPGQAVIAMQFTLIKHAPPQNAIILQKTYERRTPLAESSPQALAAGLNQGLREILTELESDLAQAL